MSTPSQEPGRIRRMSNRWSQRRDTRRGTKTLKAAYAQAARDAKRMDPVVRERIGRANMTQADLQQLAEANVAAEFNPQQWGAAAQRLNQEAADRLQAAGPDAAPTRNPFRAIQNRYTRRQNIKRGTKALKAAYAQAARDVKKMDPSVRQAIGRQGITRSDLQATSQGRLAQVFRPDGPMCV